ncbi:MAG: hypothetical protein H7Y41_04660 [Hyphomonadaceae bacterium]|nr:hypothetical protein [Clostridia bacterium]
MSCFNSISSCEMVVFAAVVALFIIHGQSAGDLNVLGNLIVAIGGLILVVAALLDYQDTAKEDEQTIENISQQIALLQKQMNGLKSC